MEKLELNKIYQGDCLEVLATFPSESIDCVVTSPPYDNLRDYKGFVFDFEKTLLELYRVIKKGGVVVWIVGDATINGSETGTSFTQALFAKSIGFNLHDTMIWDKGTFTATGSLQIRYASVFEYMFIFSKGKPKTFNPIKDKVNIHKQIKFSKTIRQKDGSIKKYDKQHRVKEFGQRHNIWRIAGEKNNNIRKLHPATFPEQIAIDHIISWTNENDVILDPFTGSGTTAVACIKLNRQYIGIEISEEYVKIANNRIKNTVFQERFNLL